MKGRLGDPALEAVANPSSGFARKGEKEVCEDLYFKIIEKYTLISRHKGSE